MSYADQVFIDMCRDILDNGTDTRGEKVRPHWEDGSPAYTVKQFGICSRYQLYHLVMVIKPLYSMIAGLISVILILPARMSLRHAV